MYKNILCLSFCILIGGQTFAKDSRQPSQEDQTPVLVHCDALRRNCTNVAKVPPNTSPVLVHCGAFGEGCSSTPIMADRDVLVHCNSQTRQCSHNP